MARTVFITGCSSGIGFESAKLFQSKGWNVVATMRKPDCDAGKELAQLSNVLVGRLDLQDTESIQPAVAAAIEKFQRIDVLINNAGYGQFGLVESVSREKIFEQFQVNVFSVIDVMKAILPHFRSNEPAGLTGRGIIMNVGSGCGKMSFPLMSLYCASKHALEALTESMSYELASQDISTKMIAPTSGIGSTNFADTSNVLISSDLSLSSYDDFVNKTWAKYESSLTGNLIITSEDVARVVYEAATDGKDQSHYYIGKDPIGVFEKKQSLSEEEFIQFVRKTFT